MDTTLQEMATDLWAHHFYENPKEGEEYEDEDFNLAAELAAIEAEAEAAAAGDSMPVPGDDDPSWENV